MTLRSELRLVIAGGEKTRASACKINGMENRKRTKRSAFVSILEVYVLCCRGTTFFRCRTEGLGVKLGFGKLRVVVWVGLVSCFVLLVVQPIYQLVGAATVFSTSYARDCVGALCVLTKTGLVLNVRARLFILLIVVVPLRDMYIYPS